MSVQTWTDEDGVKWISCDALSYGDYHGMCDVAESNIRALVQKMAGEGWILEKDCYGSKKLWLVDSEENQEVVRYLSEEYPLWDEDVHSRVQDELEQEAWEGWIKSDLLRGLPEWIRETGLEDRLGEGEAWEAYREGMEETNTQVVFESGGAYVRVERIQEAFNENVIGRLGLEKVGALVWTWTQAQVNISFFKQTLERA